MSDSDADDSEFVPMYQEYKFLRKRPGEIAVEDHYQTVESLKYRFLVWNESPARYRVYESVNYFIEELKITPHNKRLFHEVIFNQPQKLKLDIDATEEIIRVIAPSIGFSCGEDHENYIEYENEFDEDPLSAILNADVSSTPAEVFNHAIHLIISIIEDIFAERFGVDVRPLLLPSIAMDAETADKFSMHIIIDEYYVPNSAQARTFTRMVIDRLPGELSRLIDPCVNKSVQNFRLPFSRKSKSNRIFIFDTTDPLNIPEDITRAFITQVDGCIPVEFPEDEPVTPDPMLPVEFSDYITKRALELVGRPTDHTIHRVFPTLIAFKRIRPSMCEFCHRVHDNDNTLLVTMVITDHTARVYKQCRKNKDARRLLGEFTFMPNDIDQRSQEHVEIKPIQQPEEVSPIVRDILANCPAVVERWRYTDKLIAKYKPTMPSTLFDNLPTPCMFVYDEPQLRPFELCDTLVVHANMKMGKTKQLRNYINRNFADGLHQPIIRFVSFRQTFSGNIKENFSDFVLYSDVKGPLNQRRLIVQVESLHRLSIYPGVEHPDLLVLDECESIFEQFNSGLLRNFVDCWSKFLWLLSNSKHVIAMDANISDRTFRVLKRFRPQFEQAIAEQKMIYHKCTYQNATNDIYRLTGDYNLWIGALSEDINKNKRIAIPCSSLAEAKTLTELLGRRFPDKHVKLYSSETSNTEKRLHFADVNSWWAKYDILIYTPTITAGVSFEQKHFDRIYAWFTDLSTPVETSIQMIGRIRDVADRTITVYFNTTGNALPTTVESITAALNNRRQNLVKSFDETGLTPTYGPDGELILHQSPYFHLWVENMRIRNISKNDFVRHFMRLMMQTGAVQVHFTAALYAKEYGYPPYVMVGEDIIPQVTIRSLTTDKSIVKSDMAKEYFEAVAQAKDLTPDEVSVIIAKKEEQLDLTEDEKFSWERHRLRADYNYKLPITSKFVETYIHATTRAAFKHLRRLKPTLEETIDAIKIEELATHRYLMELGEEQQYRDLAKRYVFDKHRYAFGFLNTFGWTNPNDTRVIHRATLNNIIRERWESISRSLEMAAVEFEFRMPPVTKDIETVVKVVNKMLYTMYLCQIYAPPKDPDMFRIKQQTLFATVASPDEKRPVIPL